MYYFLFDFISISFEFDIIEQVLNNFIYLYLVWFRIRFHDLFLFTECIVQVSTADFAS